jgi:hypothetical protein
MRKLITSASLLFCYSIVFSQSAADDYSINAKQRESSIASKISNEKISKFKLSAGLANYTFMSTNRQESILNQGHKSNSEDLLSPENQLNNSLNMKGAMAGTSYNSYHQEFKVASMRLNYRIWDNKKSVVASTVAADILNTLVLIPGILY